MDSSGEVLRTCIMDCRRKLETEGCIARGQIYQCMRRGIGIPEAETDVVKLMRKVLAERELLEQQREQMHELQEQIVEMRVAASQANMCSQTDVNENYHSKLETQNLLLQNKVFELEAENKQLFELCDYDENKRLISFATSLTNLIENLFRSQSVDLERELEHKEAELALLCGLEEQRDFEELTMFPPSVKHKLKSVNEISEVELLKQRISVQTKEKSELETLNNELQRRIDFASDELRALGRDFGQVGELKLELEAERLRCQTLERDLDELVSEQEESERSHATVIAGIISDFSECLDDPERLIGLRSYYADLYEVYNIGNE